MRTGSEVESEFEYVLDALGHVQRRRLLVALLADDPGVDSPAVLADGDAESMEQRIEMHHVHLPKLDNYGFVDWNRETDDVKRGPRFGEIEPLLSLLVEHEEKLPDCWL